MEVGIRELKNRLSHYIRYVEAGERVQVTAHGRIVAEIAPFLTDTKEKGTRFDKLLEAGLITHPQETGDPLQGCPDLRLPKGTVKQLLDEDRDA